MDRIEAGWWIIEHKNSKDREIIHVDRYQNCHYVNIKSDIPVEDVLLFNVFIKRLGLAEF